MSKESVYDAEINPLMEAIIAICKREKIAMAAALEEVEEKDGG